MCDVCIRCVYLLMGKKSINTPLVYDSHPVQLPRTDDVTVRIRHADTYIMPTFDPRRRDSQPSSRMVKLLANEQRLLQHNRRRLDEDDKIVRANRWLTLTPAPQPNVQVVDDEAIGSLDFYKR